MHAAAYSWEQLRLALAAFLARQGQAMHAFGLQAYLQG